MFFLLLMFMFQHEGRPYCHKPCYGVLFGPKGMKPHFLRVFLKGGYSQLLLLSAGVNTGAVGSYIYDNAKAQQ